MVVLEAAAVALAKAVIREAALAIPPLICSTTVIGHHRLAAMRRRMDISWSAATLPGNTLRLLLIKQESEREGT